MNAASPISLPPRMTSALENFRQRVWFKLYSTATIAVTISSGVVIALTAGHGQDREAHSSTHDSNSEAVGGSKLQNTSDGVFKSATDYAKLIEPHLGVPPAVDLGAGIEIPIFVDGEKFTGDPGVHCCDNPSLQMGDCMSGSVVQRHEGRTADGEPCQSNSLIMAPFPAFHVAFMFLPPLFEKSF